MKRKSPEREGMELESYKRHRNEDYIPPKHRRHNISKIILGKLFLGNSIAAGDEELLKSLSITHVLNVTNSTPCHFPDDFEYLHIKQRDGENGLKKHFDEIHDFISHGGKVFVHCHRGMSRSASSVIAYLMKEYHWEYKKSKEFVKERRDCITPHHLFEQELIEFQEELGLGGRPKRVSILPKRFGF